MRAARSRAGFFTLLRRGDAWNGTDGTIGDEIGHMDRFFTKHHDCFVIQRFVTRCCEKCKKCGHRDFFILVFEIFSIFLSSRFFYFCYYSNAGPSHSDGRME